MDYEVPQKRKTKKDLKRKRRYRVYKVGGKYRTANLSKKKSGASKK